MEHFSNRWAKYRRTVYEGHDLIGLALFGLALFGPVLSGPVLSGLAVNFLKASGRWTTSRRSGSYSVSAPWTNPQHTQSSATPDRRAKCVLIKESSRHGDINRSVYLRQITSPAFVDR